ncbi:nuclear transport factor 2 family protein [Cytophaga hutchinsonii]|jgi:oxalate decarboxylase/phosphoglucose isomerase-like protein (cupin superfamily)|uniref:SnoaL-like domain-containing protein n=2 Tax=Cytophaga hutchinsonii (strain ATCC 33406 / DSM 1761 / CIP 103989 / NBRC 15051 / NCIMB 9469 / D465) TaxID=269798 RepID=A0A6N4SP05_CYTH3|nr:nuclear transport factor 2 family protein [Cytophaga hutchinsonii]ABG58023.1 hypothetical protein CHU_0736 [Cytophaga hutchinsonii ATCC 33406]SFX11634.1 SnoaL-like domain-containing protein [Cytophaga hutchinsonii ATCC 33406]
MKTQITTRDLVLEFIHALNTENFPAAKKRLNENFTFNGPMGHREGSERYMNDMEKMKFKYVVHKMFEEGNDVCLIYDINMNGKTIAASGLYHLEKGEITSLHVYFDPRPLFEE